MTEKPLSDLIAELDKLHENSRGVGSSLELRDILERNWPRISAELKLCRAIEETAFISGQNSMRARIEEDLRYKHEADLLRNALTAITQTKVKSEGVFPTNEEIYSDRLDRILIADRALAEAAKIRLGIL